MDKITDKVEINIRLRVDERELFDQNPWWKDKNLIEKDYDIEKWKQKKYKWVPDIVSKLNLNPFSFHVITGPRQTGKTTLVKLLVKELLEIKETKSIFYFNCENLSDFKELSGVINTYLDFREENSIKSSVIILDEITSPKEWYKAVKFHIDRGNFRNDILIATGSTTLEVKRETELFPGRRGEGSNFILYPLSFRKFVKLIDPELENRIPSVKILDEIEKKVSNALLFEKELNKHLKKYMEYGGFPLSVGNLGESKEEAKRVYLSWIKNAILKADRSDVIARQIIKTVIETMQTDVSWEGISKKIEIKSPKTVAAYLDLLKSIFAVNILYNIDLSKKKIRFGRNKKIHLRDPLLLDIFEDWCLIKSNNKNGAIAENLVVDHLSRMFPDNIFFWKNGFEIDVVVQEKSKLYGFESKWSEKLTNSKTPKQINKLIIVTKNKYSKALLNIPLSVFLILLDV